MRESSAPMFFLGDRAQDLKATTRPETVTNDPYMATTAGARVALSIWILESTDPNYYLKAEVFRQDAAPDKLQGTACY